MVLKVDILIGHVLRALRSLPDNSVHCVVTSPPYWGLRDYGTATWIGGDPECSHLRDHFGANPSAKQLSNQGSAVGHGRLVYRFQCEKCGALRLDQQIGQEDTLEEHLEVMVEVFREIRRILRPDGTCWINYGDAYASSAGPQVEDNKGPRRLDQGSATRNSGQAGGQRRRPSGGFKAKDLLMMPSRLAIALQDDGWWVRSEIIWAKGLSFCSTYVGSVMPESCKDRPTNSYEKVFLLTKGPRYFYDQEAIKERTIRAGATPGGGYGKRQVPTDVARGNYGPVPTMRNLRNVWVINPQPCPDAHFATFPVALVEPCIKAGSSEHGCCGACGAPYERVIKKGEPLRDWQTACGGDQNGDYTGQARKDYAAAGAENASDVKRRILEGMRERTTVGWKPRCGCGAEVVPCTVLDPFLGSGTTAAVAVSLGRSAIGIELNRSYLPIIRRRIQGAFDARAIAYTWDGIEDEEEAVHATEPV